MSVATASAILRVRLTSTTSRALPRMTVAMAQAQPTFPVPTMPIFMVASASRPPLSTNEAVRTFAAASSFVADCQHVADFQYGVPIAARCRGSARFVDQRWGQFGAGDTGGAVVDPEGAAGNVDALANAGAFI